MDTFNYEREGRSDSWCGVIVLRHVVLSSFYVQ